MSRAGKHDAHAADVAIGGRFHARALQWQLRDGNAKYQSKDNSSAIEDRFIFPVSAFENEH